MHIIVGYFDGAERLPKDKIVLDEASRGQIFKKVMALNNKLPMFTISYYAILNKIIQKEYEQWMRNGCKF